jgi:hypothetical protein
MMIYSTRNPLTTKKGPNTSIGGVWALTVSFLFYFMFLYKATPLCIYFLPRQRATGPKDVLSYGPQVTNGSNAVWYLFHFFKLLNSFLSLVMYLSNK